MTPIFWVFFRNQNWSRILLVLFCFFLFNSNVSYGVGSCSVTKLCSTLCDPMDCSTPGFPVPHHLLEFALVMPSNHLILCHLLFLPSIFPSIRVFSNESADCIRWPKFWSFSFSISPSKEYSVLISLRIYCFNLLAFQFFILIFQIWILPILNVVSISPLRLF